MTGKVTKHTNAAAGLAEVSAVGAAQAKADKIEAEMNDIEKRMLALPEGSPERVALEKEFVVKKSELKSAQAEIKAAKAAAGEAEAAAAGKGSPLPIVFAPPGAISAQIRKATMAARHSMEDAMRELDALPVSWQKHYLMAMGGGDLVNEDTQMQLRADNRNARGDKTEEGDTSGDSKRNDMGSAAADGQRKVKESAYMLSQVRII